MAPLIRAEYNNISYGNVRQQKPGRVTVGVLGRGQSKCNPPDTTSPVLSVNVAGKCVAILEM